MAWQPSPQGPCVLLEVLLHLLLLLVFVPQPFATLCLGSLGSCLTALSICCLLNRLEAADGVDTADAATPTLSF